MKIELTFQLKDGTLVPFSEIDKALLPDGRIIGLLSDQAFLSMKSLLELWWGRTGVTA